MPTKPATTTSSTGDLKDLLAEILRDIAQEPKEAPPRSPEAELALKEFNDTAARLKTWAAKQREPAPSGGKP